MIKLQPYFGFTFAAVFVPVVSFVFSVLCVFSVLAAPAMAEPAMADLRPDAPWTAERSDPVTHQVDFSIVVTPPYGCRELKVWLPLPPSDSAQQIKDAKLTTFPLQVEPQIHKEPTYGNRFAYFEFDNPRGAQIIRHRFTATVWNQRWHVDIDSVAEVAEWPSSFEPYLRAQELADETQFRSLLGHIVPRKQNVGSDLAAVMRWIDGNLTYDHTHASLTADANHALSERRGHCSDYHGLCATMGRALGYPTCVTYGLALYPKNSPSHCKMAAFLPPYGWVSYDLSETQKMVKKIQTDEQLSDEQKAALTAAARDRLQRGFRENSWLLLTKGTQYELAPKASRPVRVVRTAYIEADGQPLPEPDPANAEKREFSWMTVHRYQSDKPFKLPFKDVSTLLTDR